MNVLREVERGCTRRQWVEPISGAGVSNMSFICVPGYPGVREHERADRLAGMGTVVIRRAVVRDDI